MNRIILLTFLFFGLWACNEKPRDGSSGTVIQQSDIETVNSKYSTINLQINDPTIIDSSDWIFFPLTLTELEETEKGFESKKYGYREHVYWNVVFYNTETKQTRLLSDSLKMVIHSISTSIKNNKIYYSITITDFNQDGKLYWGDPKYLFISDLSGQGFKQVSPDNFDLVHWKTIHETNKVLIQASNVSDKDKMFKCGEIVAFIYDIEQQKIEQVFDQEFILNTKKILENQWTKKK